MCSHTHTHCCTCSALLQSSVSVLSLMLGVVYCTGCNCVFTHTDTHCCTCSALLQSSVSVLSLMLGVVTVFSVSAVTNVRSCLQSSVSVLSLMLGFVYCTGCNCSDVKAAGGILPWARAATLATARVCILGWLSLRAWRLARCLFVLLFLLLCANLTVHSQ